LSDTEVSPRRPVSRKLFIDRSPRRSGALLHRHM
jgi:hypothetical protein